jgi:hypothetical protein
MEQFIPVALGLVAAVVVLKMVKGMVKLVALVVIVALVAAAYFGMGG